MKAVGTVVYEIEDMLELNKLPAGHMVLRYDKKYGYHKMLEAGKDEFSANTARYKYFLFEPPKLPEVVIPM